MSHSAGSVTAQRGAFKYVMASEPYMTDVCYLEQFMAGLSYIKTFFKTPIALKFKCF
jgi:hypothetical protein